MPSRPATDDMKIILPLRCLIITRAASLAHRKAPVRFTSRTDLKSSAVMKALRLSFTIPALATSTSRPSPRWRVSSIMALT